MKIYVITDEFYPVIGGIGKTFTSMCKAFKKRTEKLFIFNQNFKGKDIFDILDFSDKYNIKDLSVLIKKRKYLLYFILSVWKLLTAKNVKLYSKLNMVLYILIKPDVLIKLVKNLLLIHPLLKKIKPDLIFGNTCGRVILPLGLISSKLMRTKFICSAHGTDFLVYTHYSLKTHYLKGTEKIIVHSNRLKELIIKINHINDNQVVIIPPGLYLQDYHINQEKDQIREDLNISPEDFILISVGRHVPRKNFQLVIKAIKIIKEKHPHLQIKYFLIGEGKETANLKEMRNKFNLEKEIFFLGATHDAVKNKYMKLSDVFIMPSIALKNSIEGFGLVYLEANFYKLPVIGTITGGISEVIEHDRSGLLIRPNDLNGLINAILYLYDHKEKRKNMGEYSHNKVINNYDWDLIVNKYVDLFHKIID